MFKLVVLFALVAVAAAKPSLYHEIVAPSAVVTKTLVSPGAVSSTYREDVISKPAAVAYAAHSVPSLAYSAPVAYSAPLVAESVAVAAAAPAVVTKTVVSPAAVSSTYREDIISKPSAVLAYAAPSAPIVAKTIVAEPSAVAVSAPVVTKTVVSPAAVSSTYREDVISKPAALAYSAPAFAYSAPAAYHVAAPAAYHVAAPAAYHLAAPSAYAVHAW